MRKDDTQNRGAFHIFLADLNGTSGSISDLKPKGPGLESQIRQGYICWWRGSKRSGCVMNVCTDVFKEPDYQLTTCSTCTVEGKM
jgi:hypothetical protein